MHTYNCLYKDMVTFLDYDIFNDSLLKKIVLFICEDTNLKTVKIDLDTVFTYSDYLLFSFLIKNPIIFFFFVKIIISKKIKTFIYKYFFNKKIFNKKINISFNIIGNIIKNITNFNHYIGKLVKCSGSVVKKENINLCFVQKIYFNEFLSLIHENNMNFFSKYHILSDIGLNFNNYINNIDFGFSKLKNFGFLKVITNIPFKPLHFINLFVEKYFFEHVIPGDNIECGGIFLVFFLNKGPKCQLNAKISMISVKNYLKNKKSHQFVYLFLEVLFSIAIHRFMYIWYSLEKNFLITDYFPIGFKKIFLLMFTGVNKNKKSDNIYKFKKLSFLLLYEKDILKKQLSIIINYLCDENITVGHFSFEVMFDYGLNFELQVYKKILFNLISITSKKIILINELNRLNSNSVFFFHELIEHQILNFSNLGHFVKIYLDANYITFLKNNRDYKCLTFYMFNHHQFSLYIQKYDLVFNSCKIKKKDENFKISTYLQFKHLHFELNTIKLDKMCNYIIVNRCQKPLISTFSSIKKFLIYVNKNEKKIFYSKKTKVLLKLLFYKLRVISIYKKKYFINFLISRFSSTLIKVSILNSLIRISSKILIFDIVQSIYLLQFFQFSNIFS
uniref:MCM-domain-containing protein n=1 Tax=Lotharella vacuolata TaxID=74820 RepID=A0A0H5BK31_9EUKA|nr:MCM-domain-containing protein [Lotharella vacuolata]